MKKYIFIDKKFSYENCCRLSAIIKFGMFTQVGFKEHTCDFNKVIK